MQRFMNQVFVNTVAIDQSVLTITTVPNVDAVSTVAALPTATAVATEASESSSFLNAVPRSGGTIASVAISGNTFTVNAPSLQQSPESWLHSIPLPEMSSIDEFALPTPHEKQPLNEMEKRLFKELLTNRRELSKVTTQGKGAGSSINWSELLKRWKYWGAVLHLTGDPQQDSERVFNRTAKKLQDWKKERPRFFQN